MSSFFTSLLDTRNKTVDATIFFTLICIFAIIVYGFILVCLDYKDFHISDFGTAFGWMFAGSAAHATGSGFQSKMMPPDA